MSEEKTKLFSMFLTEQEAQLLLDFRSWRDKRPQEEIDAKAATFSNQLADRPRASPDPVTEAVSVLREVMNRREAPDAVRADAAAKLLAVLTAEFYRPKS